MDLNYRLHIRYQFLRLHLPVPYDWSLSRVLNHVGLVVRFLEPEVNRMTLKRAIEAGNLEYLAKNMSTDNIARNGERVITIYAGEERHRNSLCGFLSEQGMDLPVHMSSASLVHLRMDRGLYALVYKYNGNGPNSSMEGLVGIKELGWQTVDSDIRSGGLGTLGSMMGLLPDCNSSIDLMAMAGICHPDGLMPDEWTPADRNEMALNILAPDTHTEERER